MIFSCVIPCSQKDLESENLKDLIASIREQDFQQDQIEILTITEGDSESAKGIGIKQAKGEILCMLCADNYFVRTDVFTEVYRASAFNITGVYSKHYAIVKNDNSLNRYFSLIGGNDVVCFYLGKNDRKPYYELKKEERFVCMDFNDGIPSLGCNGTFFFRDKVVNNVDLNNYYPMDAAEDLRKNGWVFYMRLNMPYLWHRTSDKLIPFLIKRYKYARDLYCDRSNRRWKMLDRREDYWRLLYFIVSTIGIIPAFCVSARGFFKIRDFAWFWHWPVCVGFLITYGILTCRTLLARLLSRQLGVKNALKYAFSPLPNNLSKTTKSS